LISGYLSFTASEEEQLPVKHAAAITTGSPWWTWSNLE